MSAPGAGTADEEWRRCADWLLRCLTEYPDILQQASSVLDAPDATLLDFLNCLKDGVLLCHTLPALSSQQVQVETLPGFKLATLNSVFAFRQNLFTFMDVCRGTFGLPEAELFNPEDLLNQENVSRVIRCLSLLSQSAKARQSGIAGFDVGGAGNATDDTDGYCSLLSTATAAAAAAAAASMLPVPGKGAGGRKEYGDIAAERVYEHIFNRSQGPELKEEVGGAPLSPKEMCIREIVSTERAYVDILKLLVEDVMRPLKEPNSSWNPVEVDAVFECLPELLTIHRRLLRELEVATQLRGSKSLPIVLTEHHAPLLMYGRYCSHMPVAIKSLEDVTRSDKKKLEELQKHMDAARSQFKLSEYLTVPMQRVLRYHLLLTSLIKFDEKAGGGEQAQLQTALETMKDVASYVNEVKRDTEMRALIEQIQAQISNLDLPGNLRLIDYGRLELDDDLRIANDPAKPLAGSKPCTCFLWTRLLMLTKTRPSLTFKSAFAVKPNLVIRELDSAASTGSTSSGGGSSSGGDSKWTWAFLVSEPGTSKNQQPEKGRLHFVFLAKSRDARQRWLEAFNRAKDNVAPPNYNTNGHYFELRTLESPAYCSVCTKLIHGCFFQGYTCRKTGLIVHKQCIPTKPFVPQHLQQQQQHNNNSARHSSVSSASSCNSTEAAWSGSVYASSQESAVSTGRPQSLMSQTSYTGGSSTLGSRGHAPQVSRRDTITYVAPLTPPDGSGGGGGAARSPRASPAPQSQPRFSQQMVEALEVQTSQLQFQRAVSPGALSSPRVAVSLPQPTWADYYAGVMSRDEARDILMQRPAGAYLVRESQGSADYAISLRYGETVKHMRVLRSPEGYRLGDNRNFATVQELVTYYSTNSLRECFLELESMLRIPFKSRELSQQRKSSKVLGWATVLRDYDAPPSSGHISLRVGEVVTVFGQDEDVWSGKKMNGQFGKFPADTVGTLSTSPEEGYQL